MRARAQFERALALDPKQDEALRGLAGIASSDGHFDEALRLLTSVAEHDPRDVLLLRQLSLVYRDLGDNDQSAQALQRAVAIDPTDQVDKLFLAGAIRRGTGDLARARQIIQSIRATPGQQWNPFVVGSLLYIQIWQRDGQAAAQVAGEAPANAFEHPWSRTMYLGMIASIQHQDDRARSDFAQASNALHAYLKQHSDDADAEGDLAEALAHLGQADAALAAGRRAVALRSNDRSPWGKARARSSPGADPCTAWPGWPGGGDTRGYACKAYDRWHLHVLDPAPGSVVGSDPQRPAIQGLAWALRPFRTRQRAKVVDTSRSRCAMTDLWTKLRQRKLVQWALAYVAFAFALLQGIDLVAQPFGWPPSVLRLAILALAVGFVLALLLAWYHGEQGRQRVSGTELMIITLVLAFGGVLLWFVGRSASRPAMPTTPVAATARVASVVHEPAPPATSTAIPAKSIAVLPFENLSSDKNNAYFADGMQDLILTKLASIGDLAVISRTSTLQYGSHPQNLTKIGKELGVATLLEGSVQKAGDQVLVNVQLIDTRNDHHIWADSYTRTLKNVFSVEGEVAQKIADTLKARLSPAETRRLATTLSSNTEANDLYLQGEYFANRGNINYDTAAMKQAIAFYRQAIAKAPDFAQARAQLSFMESQLAWFGGGGEKTAPLYADALTQAEQALKLAPDLADAHHAMGLYDYWGKGDYSAALKALAAALALRPNDSIALLGKAAILRRQGKFDEAIGVFQKALTLDPRNTLLASEMASTYMALSQYAVAEQTFQRALALDPANVNARAHFALTIVYRSGDLTKALAQVQGDNPRLALGRVGILTLARKYDQALTLLQSIPYSPGPFATNNRGTKSMQLAYLYELRGEPAKARAFYAKALPQVRAQYAALAGSPVINQALVLNEVARAELGIGRTKAGLTDTARVLAIAENGSDHLYRPLLMERCAERYAQAGRAVKAVQVLSDALATPGIGTWYSPVMLWIDPRWDPIRKTPQFRALLKKYTKDRPANATDGGVAKPADVPNG